MDKTEIIKILEEWNFWKRTPDTGIRREIYLKQLIDILDTNQVAVITGARRSGKSFIMRQLAEFLIQNGTSSSKGILFVNFEDPRFVDLNVKLLQQIYEIYLEFLNPEQIPYVFLDEVQEVEKWEKWVRMMQELRKAKIIISGSNARLLSQELSTLLTGRHIDLTVFPLSFKEYLTFNNVKIDDRLDILSKRLEINRLLRGYLEFGSFPQVVLNERKGEILLSYFDDILNKDLIRRFHIRKTERLKNLAKFYLSNVSNPTTFSSTEKFIQVSADTIEKYSGYFESAYLFFFHKRFSYKVKEQEKSPRKIYAIDTGLANMAGFRFTENIGKVAENIVFLELKRKQTVEPDLEIYYWKNEHHQEVDFILKKGTKVGQLIQVCWRLDSPEARKREVRSLFKALDEFNLGDGLIITEEIETEEEIIKGKKITYISLWRWLLEQKTPSNPERAD